MDTSSPSPTAYLVPRTERPGLEEKYVLHHPHSTVGRHPTNTICIPLDSISRFHARIDLRGSHYILQDLNSSNGTFVNGERISSATLHDSDLVVFGNVDFEFVNEASATRGMRRETPEIHTPSLDIRETPLPPGRRPGTTKVIRATDIRDTSSYISSSATGDRETLVKVNNRLATLYALSELLRESASRPEKEILSDVLDLVFESVSADRGAILTRFSRDAREFDVAVIKHRERPIFDEKLAVSRTILDRVVNEKVAVLSSDALTDERFQGSESIIAQNIRSTMCVPMISEARVLGIIHLDTQTSRKHFTEDDLEFVTSLATEVAVSIENMRMREERFHRERLAAVGETVAGISHNVKNILLLSQGGSEILDRALEAGDLGQSRESWSVVRRGIDKIGKLVKDMLDYSSTRKPSLASVDVNELICQIAEEIEEVLVKSNIRLVLELDESLDEFRTDEHGLSRTLTNLLINAAESIPHDEGLITVTTELTKDGWLLTRVRDNGTGIPPDRLEKIFLPFFSTKGSHGTGLGLPTCRKFVEDLGGTLTVESTPDEGSTFTILLPSDTTGAGMEETTP